MPFEHWIEAWRAQLTALVAGWGASWADAAEIAQDALVEGYLGRERLQGDPRDRSVAGPWLGGIARNLFLAHMRSRTRTLSLDALHAEGDRLGEATPSLGAGSEDPRLDVLRREMARLPEHLRSAVYLRYLEEGTNAEVASLLGITERAVEGRLRQARQRLARATRPKDSHDTPS